MSFYDGRSCSCNDWGWIDRAIPPNLNARTLTLTRSYPGPTSPKGRCNTQKLSNNLLSWMKYDISRWRLGKGLYLAHTFPISIHFGRWKRRPGGAGERIAAYTTKITMNHTHNNGYVYENIFWGNTTQNIDDIVGYGWQKNAILVAGNCAFWWVDFDHYGRTSQVKVTGQVNESILSFYICILYALARGIGG